MAEVVKLQKGNLAKLREIDPRLISYNVEMTEVTGGTFWKAYTPEQIDGTEAFPVIEDWRDMAKLQQYYEPINLYHPRLRKLAKELGSAWVRVSGTWANKTYYDLDGHTNGVVPEGFENLLLEEQWKGVLDFVKAVNGKLLVSVANCPGIHKADEPWNPEQARQLFDYSRNYGVPIQAVEFTNEPNMMALSGLPAGYTAEDFTRDHDIFCSFIRENYPDVLLVGPCTCGDVNLSMPGKDGENVGGGIASALEIVTTDELIGNAREKLDVFSYHCYNGISERGAAMGGHWQEKDVLSEKYLSLVGECARAYLPVKEKYVPGAQMWVTEAGDAGCGGNTWASTYLDIARTLNEFGLFATITDGIIFHNTLASSDYGYLQHGTFEPRPSYFAVLLWNRIMGTTVYDSGEEIREGAHVYAHSRKDGKEGVAYLVINNSRQETVVELPKSAECYVLSAEKMRARQMLLNGKPLCLGENDELPDMSPVTVEAGNMTITPAACAFIVL